MTSFVSGLITGVVLGLCLSGFVTYAGCCAQLDVPLDYQIEQEYQQLLRESEKPNYPSGAPDAWRSGFVDQPCKR